MDKNELKKIHRQFLAAIEADGYPILFAGIPPVLPEYEKPYKLQIYSPKLMAMGSYDAMLSLLIENTNCYQMQSEQLFQGYNFALKSKILLAEKKI